jgi:hypothetical protein
MKRRDKKMLFKGLFIAVVVMAVGILWASNYTLPVDDVTGLVTSASWVESLHGFFLDIYNVLSTDYYVIIIIAVAVIGAYYFLVYRPKLARR